MARHGVLRVALATCLCAFGRIEIYIESLFDQRVRIEKLDLEVDFAVGELIHTENSYKYDMDGIARLAAETGFERSHTWFDSRERFSSNLLLAA